MARILLVLALVFGWLAAPTQASPPGKYRWPSEGRVEAVRPLDLDGDGRKDLALLVGITDEDGVERQEIVLLRTPKTPTRGSFYDPAAVRRIRVDDGVLARAGAVAVGRFGSEGQWRLRFIGQDGLFDLDEDGVLLPADRRLAVPTLLSRSPGRSLVFWDQVADLDGDRIDDLWFPAADGRIRILAGTPGAAVDQTLALEAPSRGVTDFEHLVRRHAYVPNLQPADLDGDGRVELVAFRSPSLIAWRIGTPTSGEAVEPTWELALPFVRNDLGPDEVHTPRLELHDVNQDGCADLLVTLVTGDRRQLGSFRTRLLHFPGPFRDPATGGLVPPAVRIDTESVALHTCFEDIDGDGALDYVSDAIRGTKLDLIKRVLGQDPTIWHVAFRFDRSKGTFETVPYFSVERPYSREEAVSNHFGRTGYFEGDFDGDGHRDLLDLGDLQGVEILKATPKRARGPGDPVAFDEALQPRLRIPTPFAPDALIVDLLGDGGVDAVLWSRDTLYLLVTESAR